MQMYIFALHQVVEDHMKSDRLKMYLIESGHDNLQYHSLNTNTQKIKNTEVLQKVFHRDAI